MIITYHDSFEKSYRKRIAKNPKLATKTRERIKQFAQNPHHQLLEDHALKGTKKGLRAFSITGDYRIIYRPLSENEVVLIDIGTHPQIY